MRIVEGPRLKSSRFILISSPTTSLRRYNTRPRLCPNVSCRCSVRFLVDNGVSTGRLARLVGSSVKVTLEIEAGAPEQVVRTVTENRRTLKFTTHGFEQK